MHNTSAFNHHNKIYALATEMYKVTDSIFPKIMNEVFKETIPILMKSILHNFLNPAHSVYVTESALYFGPTIWVQIPSEIRNKEFLVGFKREIKKWKPTDCPIVSLIIQIS